VPFRRRRVPGSAPGWPALGPWQGESTEEIIRILREGREAAVGLRHQRKCDSLRLLDTNMLVYARNGWPRCAAGLDEAWEQETCHELVVVG